MKSSFARARTWSYAWLIVTLLSLMTACERGLQIENAPAQNTSITSSENMLRISYDWPAGKVFFEPITPSRLEFFEKTKDTVRDFLASDPMGRPPSEFFLPEGLNHNAIKIAERFRYANAMSTPLLSVPILEKSFCFSISRDGSRLAIYEGGNFVVWDIASKKEITRRKCPFESVSGIAFNHDGQGLYALCDKTIVWVDLENDRPPTLSKAFPGKITQFAVAVEVDTLAVVCEAGEIFVADRDLVAVNQVPKAKATSNVAISDRGDRIAFWNEGTPTEIELDGVELGRREIVESFPNRGGTRYVVAGRFTTQWMDGRSIFQWWHRDAGMPEADRRVVVSDLTWDPIQVVSTNPMEFSDSRLMVAKRKGLANSTETVLVDINCTSRASSQSLVLPPTANGFCFSYSGDRFAIAQGNEIQVIARHPWQNSGYESFCVDVFNAATMDDIANQLDLCGEFILGNDFWWRFGLSAQDVFTEFAQVIGEQWSVWEASSEPTKEIIANLAHFEDWYSQEGELARAASGFRRRLTAWRAVKTSDRRSFTFEGRANFQDEMQKLRKDISPLLTKKKPCNAAYVLLLFYTLTTDTDLSKVDLILEKSTKMYPECTFPLVTTIPMLTEQWLGQSDDASSFAREARSLYGDYLGRMVYPRLCIAVSRMYADRQAVWSVSRLNPDLMIDGLNRHAESDTMSKRLFHDSLTLFHSNEDGDARLNAAVGNFCDKYAFVPHMNTKTPTTGTPAPSNAARYFVLRFMALKNGEPLPDFFR